MQTAIRGFAGFASDFFPKLGILVSLFADQKETYSYLTRLVRTSSRAGKKYYTTRCRLPNRQTDGQTDKMLQISCITEHADRQS